MDDTPSVPVPPPAIVVAPSIDVTRVPLDPLVELERLRQTHRRWKRAALAAGAAFVFLFVMSMIQFMGTFLTAKLLYDARRDVARVNRETSEYMRQIKESQQKVEAASADAIRASMVLNQLGQMQEKMEKMGAANLDEHKALMAEWKALEEEVQILRARARLAEAEMVTQREAKEQDKKRVIIGNPGPKRMPADEPSDAHNGATVCPFPMLK